LPELILILIDLLDDLDRRVATSAASALGRMGRVEARPILKKPAARCPIGGCDRCSIATTTQFLRELRQAMRQRPELGELIQ
jgi:hypothetical protein